MTSTLVKQARRRGFTLVELLMVVAVISTFAAGAIFGISNVTQAASDTKLQRDVNVVNSAIRSYLLNGGTFLESDLKNPTTLLAKLKKKASAQSAKEIAGLRGSMADERLTYEVQAADEAVDGVPRARFLPDPLSPRFVIETSGPPGIRRFVLDSNLAKTDFGTEDRKSTLKLAKQDRWVWDYNESLLAGVRPGAPPPSNPAATNPSPPDAAILFLTPPQFSISSGTVALQLYPRALSLLPTNPPGTARIAYSINGGPFLPYAGPINVDPGMTVTGVSLALDNNNYDDSTSVSHTYLTTPVTPQPALSATKTAYTYFDLGGEAAPSTSPAEPVDPVYAAASITNASEIPVPYQNSSNLRMLWTTDGTNPLSSGTASRQDDFQGGFPSVKVPVTLSSFGTSRFFTVQAAVKSENPAVLNNSGVVSRSFGVAVINLRQPLITFDGTDATLTLDTSNGDMPKDARIYYTTDGSDPGVDHRGNPLRGTLYTGTPITVTGQAGANVAVSARVYAPVSYPQYFAASGMKSDTVRIPVPLDVYVGGNFVNPSGELLRNLAKLNSTGQVDTSFNTGAGASAGSLIGIVRQSPGGVLAGGDFQSMNGTARPGLVRLNANGSVDASFNAALSND